jgi:hypothetical protein
MNGRSNPTHFIPTEGPDAYLSKYVQVNTYTYKGPQQLTCPDFNTGLTANRVTLRNTCFFPYSAAFGSAHSLFDKQGQICNRVS